MKEKKKQLKKLIYTNKPEMILYTDKEETISTIIEKDMFIPDEVIKEINEKVYNNPRNKINIRNK